MGSDRVAHRSPKLKGIEPLGYLADICARIVNCHPDGQIDEILSGLRPRAQLKSVARGVGTTSVAIGGGSRIVQLARSVEADNL